MRLSSTENSEGKSGLQMFATRTTVLTSHLKCNCLTANRRDPVLNVTLHFFFFAFLAYWIFTELKYINKFSYFSGIWHIHGVAQLSLLCRSIALLSPQRETMYSYVVILSCPPNPVNHSFTFHLYAFHSYSGCFDKEAHSMWFFFCLDNILSHLR